MKKHYWVEIQREKGGAWEPVQAVIAKSGSRAIKEVFPPSQAPARRAVPCKGCPVCSLKAPEVKEKA